MTGGVRRVFVKQLSKPKVSIIGLLFDFPYLREASVKAPLCKGGWQRS